MLDMILIWLPVGIFAFIVGFVNGTPQVSWKDMAIRVMGSTVLITVLGVTVIDMKLFEALLVALFVSIAGLVAAPLGAKVRKLRRL